MFYFGKRLPESDCREAADSHRGDAAHPIDGELQ
jgi:hypothetical protein